MKFSKIRIFISVALITFLSVKVRAHDDDDFYATTLIHQTLIVHHKNFDLSPAVLSADIPNAQKFDDFFKSLSGNFLEACKTVEKAQFFVSAVQPPEMIERFNTIISGFDEIYHEFTNRQTMKENVIATKNQLIEYGNEIAPFTFVPYNWFNATKFVGWTQGHASGFKDERIGKKLSDYLKYVNRLIASIQRSIDMSQKRIEHPQLKRLGIKILRGVEKFLDSVDDVVDVTNSINEIRSAINGVRTTRNGKYFNDMRTNAGKMLHDLNQLKLLMERQWLDMDYIFRTRNSPPQLPTVTLAN